MALADQAGLVTVKEINSETLPHVAQIVNDTLQQVAVILNGTVNGIEGERILAMQGLKDEVIGPLTKELALWRGEIQNLTAQVSRFADFLDRVQIGAKQ